MLVQPDTGLLISRNLEAEAKVYYRESGWRKTAGQDPDKVILPLPGLDRLAGQSASFYQLSESLVIG